MQDESLRETHNALSQWCPTLNVLENAKKLFGLRLKAAREAKGYTQKQLGKLLGVTGNSVARIESGLHGPRWAILEGIFRSLDQPPSFYFSAEAPASAPRAITPEEAIKILERAISDKGLLKVPIQPSDERGA